MLAIFDEGRGFDLTNISNESRMYGQHGCEWLGDRAKVFVFETCFLEDLIQQGQDPTLREGHRVFVRKIS